LKDFRYGTPDTSVPEHRKQEVEMPLPRPLDLNDPAAFIISAIEKNWPEPTAAARLRKATAAKQQQQQQQATRQRQDEESSAARARDLAELAALEPARRGQLEAQVRQAYETRWPGQRLPQPVVDAGVRSLLRGLPLEV
jgi:hypothetical protein